MSILWYHIHFVHLFFILCVESNNYIWYNINFTIQQFLHNLNLNAQFMVSA